MEFPINPIQGQEYTVSNKVWVFNGKGWALKSTTVSYSNLDEKPSINSVELVGNKTALELGLALENHTHDYEPAIPKSTGMLSWTGTAWAWVVNIFVPNTRKITINGSQQDLTADRTWTIATGDPNSHTHANKAALDKIAESAGNPTWNGGAWPGGAGIDDEVTAPDSTWSSEKISEELTGKEAAGTAQNLVTQLIDGATDNTLKKLQDKIAAINAIIGGSTADGDNLVNTVAELLAVFSSFPEGADMVTLLTAKLNVSDVYNALDRVLEGKALDARQGKVLNDLIAELRYDLGNINPTPANNSITNLKLAQVPTATIKGRASSGTGDVEDLTAAQALALIGAKSATYKGALDAIVVNAGYSGTLQLINWTEVYNATVLVDYNNLPLIAPADNLCSQTLVNEFSCILKFPPNASLTSITHPVGAKWIGFIPNFNVNNATWIFVFKKVWNGTSFELYETANRVL